ncbi:hypothetical protein AAVH_28076 [Aphelenchoides avenae]|nr:hypothetical protein AAVH_28076 [Aphelenchus avenae]
MFFVIPDKEKNDYITRDPRVAYYPDNLERVDDAWKSIFKLYMSSEPAHPLDYLDSLELALTLKGEVDDEDVRAIFAQGKPLEFWSCPPMLVSKIVQCIEVTRRSEIGPSLALTWPEADQGSRKECMAGGVACMAPL